MEEYSESLLTMKSPTNVNNNTLEKLELCDCDKRLEEKSRVNSKAKTRVICITSVIVIFVIISIVIAIVVLNVSGGGKEKMSSQNQTTSVSSTTISVLNTSLSSTTKSSTNNVSTSTTSTTEIMTECSSGQFRCESGQCVEASSRCDEYPQCFDKSDEMNCSNCTGFQCASGQCLWTDSVECNFHIDCIDLSDEMNCDMPPGYERCENGLLVHRDKICDGVDDCFDNTDESRCGMMCNVLAEISCDDKSKCIMRDWLCDGYVDCPDGSDENDCGKCSSDEAQCSDYKCIPTEQVCDGIKQCNRGDDEVDCLKLTNGGMTDSLSIVTVKSHDQFLPVCSHGLTSSVADQICQYFGYRNSLRIGEVDEMRAGVTLSQGFMVLKESLINWSFDQSLLAKFVKIQTCPENKVVGIQCRQNSCGERKVDVMTPFIVGGTRAPAGKWPWVVSITKLGEGWCGGVIVNHQWILTSAHCIVTSSTNYTSTPHYFEVTAGTIKRQRHIDGHAQRKRVDEIILHPQMNLLKTGITEWDLALLHLKSPLTYGDYIQPICFPDENEDFPIQSQCYLAGWGFINFQEVSVTSLREGKMMLWSDSDCAANGVSSPLNTNATVCAGYNSGAISACKGDSGSPLMCSDERGKWTAVGVMSHGVDGCHGKPLKRVNRYAKVSTSINWIQMSTGG